MDRNEFINHEIATWGEEYIFTLLDRGFEPVQVFNAEGHVKWTWVLPRVTVESRVSA